MSEQKSMTVEARREAIETVASTLRKLADGLTVEELCDVTEAALRQAIPCHVVIQAAYFVTACDPSHLKVQS